MKSQKIYVAGHRVMVDSAIVRQLLAQGVAQSQIVTRTHAELDLTRQPSEVETLLSGPNKAKQKLDRATEITTQTVVRNGRCRLDQAKQHALLKAKGYNINVSLE